jgi:dephospho-CoA kinase
VRRPLVVGLTGGIGSGKSEALAAFRRHGASILSSDEVVRELYLRPEVIRAVVEHFGRRALDAGGAVDRARVAEWVFADAEQRSWLEGLLLPLIAERFSEWRDVETAAGAPLLVHEAPTLFEAGIERRYDTIVTVTAPQDVREARRPGAAERMAHQLPEDEKVARSQHVFHNTGSLDDLDRWVAELVRELT